MLDPASRAKVRRRSFVAFVLTDVIAGLALAVAYGLRFGACAPPSVLCQLGQPCVAVCSDPWAQFPQVVAIGMLSGLVPAGMIYFAVSIFHKNWFWFVRRWRTWSIFGLLLGAAALYAGSQAWYVIDPGSRSATRVVVAIAFALVAAAHAIGWRWRRKFIASAREYFGHGK